MSEKIFTITINEAFQIAEGCPICRLFKTLEENALSYVLGEAMMEPEVRIKMNESGFCTEHFKKLAGMKNKLSLALIMESHLTEVNNIFSVPSRTKKKFMSKRHNTDACDFLQNMSVSCFVCSRIKRTSIRYYSNIVYLWQSDSSFREKFMRQPYFCITHSAGILNAAKNELSAFEYGNIYDSLLKINSSCIKNLQKEINDFTVSFDHRNAGIPMPETARSSIENAIKFLR